MRNRIAAIAALALVVAIPFDASAQSGGGSSGGGSSGGASSGGPATSGDAARPIGNPTAPANRGLSTTPAGGGQDRGSSGRPGGGTAQDHDATANETKADDPSLNQGIYRTTK